MKMQVIMDERGEFVAAGDAQTEHQVGPFTVSVTMDPLPGQTLQLIDLPEEFARLSAGEFCERIKKHLPRK